MAASDAVPVIIGAAIGAGGAVLAQITAQVFSGRRDARRLQWEQDRQEREWDDHRGERFLDLKRELYSDYLAHAEEFMSFISPDDNPLGFPEREHPDAGELHRIRVNIGLIAPQDVSKQANAATFLLLSATRYVTPTGAGADEEARAHYYSRFAGGARDALAKTRRAMRADLRGEAEGYFGVRRGGEGAARSATRPRVATVAAHWAATPRQVSGPGAANSARRGRVVRRLANGPVTSRRPAARVQGCDGGGSGSSRVCSTASRRRTRKPRATAGKADSIGRRRQDRLWPWAVLTPNAVAGSCCGSKTSAVHPGARHAMTGWPLPRGWAARAGSHRHGCQLTITLPGPHL